MKFSKMAYLFLLLVGCFALLSGCRTNAGVLSSSSGPTPTMTTPTILATPTTSTSTSTFTANCPAADGIGHGFAHGDKSTAAVFYLTAWGGTQSGLNPLNLIRYDLTTGKTSTLLSFAGTSVGTMPQVQLSPSKLLLLVVNTNTANSTSVKLISSDPTKGIQPQTLCTSSGDGLRAIWLPDGLQVAISQTHYDQQQNTTSYTTAVLNLATGTLQTVLSGDYFPYAWIDGHRLIVAKENSTLDRFALFDTNNGSHQKFSDLTQIASFPYPIYGSVTTDSSRSHVFTSSYTSSYGNCQGALAGGPSTVNSVTTTGDTHTIYSSQTLAILAIYPVSAQTLLMYSKNTTGDLSQNGLWKINTDGTGLTRLTTEKGQICGNIGWGYSPQIASNDQSYALLLTPSYQSIVVGSLSGGTPTTIVTSKDLGAQATKMGGFLQLIGMA